MTSAHVLVEVRFGYSIGLVFDDASVLTIATPFALSRGEGSSMADPEDAALVSHDLVRLLQHELELSVSQSVSIDVVFEDLRITVPPSDEYEAWQLVSADGQQTVCLPGGGTSTWGPS